MKKLVFLVILAAVLSVTVAPVQAATEGIIPCGIDTNGNKVIDREEACGLCDVFQLANNLIIFFLFPAPNINNGFAVVPLVATFFLMLGGFYIVIAAGRPNLQERGKTILTAVVIGLLIVYTAWVLLNTVLTLFGVATWTGLGSWWQIPCTI